MFDITNLSHLEQHFDPATLATKDRILFLSIHLFAEKGYDAVSVREIARNVGIKESSIYNHFPSKESILNSIFDFLDTDTQHLLSLPADESIKNLKTIDDYRKFEYEGLMLWKQRINNPFVYPLIKILSAEQFRNPRARCFIEKWMIIQPKQFYAKLYQHMIDQKIIKPFNPEMLAIESVAFLVYIYFTKCLFNNNEMKFDDIADLAKQHIDTFCNFLN